MDYKEFLKEAYDIAAESLDPSTQNGAVLVNDYGRVISRGNNHFPAGVLDKPERWEKPLKYKIIEHAERAAIYAAAKNGYQTKGLTLVCCWAACPDCSRAIIESGIKRLVTHKQALDRSPAFWKQEIDVAFEMLKEAGVEIVFYDGHVGGKPVRHTGEVWNP